MTTFLVCAHETLTSPELAAALQRHVGAGPTRFHLVVPMTHHVGPSAWSEGEIHAQAERDLDAALAHFRAEGYDVSGEVGDLHPVDAVLTALVTHPPDTFAGIILSTHASSVSRWLRLDALTRLERETTLPVEHVAAAKPSTLVR